MAKAEYRSAIRSRKLIAMALADLLQEKPLDKITVTDVVRRAGINRGTFYAHYSDLPEVLHSLIEQMFSHLRDTVFQADYPLAHVPGVFLAGVQQIVEDNLDFCRKVIASSASIQMEHQLVQLFVDYLLQNENQFGFGSHAEYMMTIRFCAGGLVNLYRGWFSGAIDMPLEELTHQAEKLLVQLIPTAAVVAEP